jgi:Cu/Ag efflux pump CusA
VAEINTWGGYEKQYHVIVDPQRLIKHELTLDDVARVMQRGNRNAGGGVLDQAGEAQLIQGQGLVSGTEDLEAMVLASVDGTPIHLHDVAEVREDHEIRRGAVTYQGQGEAVLGLGFMLMGENSRELTQKLEARLEQAKRSLPEGADLTEVYSRNDLVGKVLETVRTNLLEGVEGKLFRPMALTVIFALAGSMLLSMTLMPVLASYTLKKGKAHGDNRIVTWLKNRYRPLLTWALDHRKSVLTVAALAVLNAGLLATRLGSEFVPRLREQAVVINTVRIAGVF